METKTPENDQAIDSQVTQGDFELFAAGGSFRIKKINFILHSETFRNSPELINEESLVIPEYISTGSVGEFANALMGREFVINDDNVYDLLSLAEKWKIDAMYNSGLKYIKDNSTLENLIAQLKKDGSNYNSAVECVLSSKLDQVLQIESFKELSTIKICNVLSNKSKLCTNNNELFTFVMNLAEQRPNDANMLLQTIDFKNMTPEQAALLFSHPSFQTPETPSEKPFKKLINQLDVINLKLIDLQGNRDSTHTIEEGMASIQNGLTIVQNQKETIEDVLAKAFEQCFNRKMHLDRKVKADTKCMQNDFRGIKQKLDKLEASINAEFCEEPQDQSKK